MINAQGDLVSKVTGIDGIEYEFNFNPIKRMDAIFVSHNIFQSGLKAVAGAVDSDEGKQGLSKGLMALISDMSFEKLEAISDKLLNGFHLNKKPADPKETDFLGSRPDLFYQALYEGVKINLPDFFEALKKNKMLLSMFQAGKTKAKDALSVLQKE